MAGTGCSANQINKQKEKKNKNKNKKRVKVAAKATYWLIILTHHTNTMPL